MKPGRKWLAPCVLAVAASAAVAGCSTSSSGSSSSADSSASGGSSTGGAASSGVTYAQQQVTADEAATSTYPVPTASVSGVSKLRGKTVYYIPLVQDIPQFVVTAAALKTALAKAGVNLQVCNGEAQPSAIASCVSQAAGASAAGIILDSIPEGMAANAITAANGKKIPVIIADQIAPAGTANTSLLTYVPGVIDQPSQIAYWMIADSDGKANVIINEEADSPSSIAYITNAEAVYKRYCSGCTVTVKPVTATSTQTEIASQVSSNLLSHPSATYYYTEFEDSLQPTIEGIQQSSKTGISLSEAGGTVDGLGLLAKGSDGMQAVVTVDEAYAGWALADEALRLGAGSAPVSEPFPSRLFTRQNIGSIQVTAADQDSGAWFGNDSYQSEFAKLWGVG
jgi:ribose transport system substrate-binding protein